MQFMPGMMPKISWLFMNTIFLKADMLIFFTPISNTFGVCSMGGGFRASLLMIITGIFIQARLSMWNCPGEANALCVWGMGCLLSGCLEWHLTSHTAEFSLSVLFLLSDRPSPTRLVFRWCHIYGCSLSRCTACKELVLFIVTNN